MKNKNLTLLFILTFFLLIIPMSIFGATGYEYLANQTRAYYPFETNVTNTLGKDLTGTFNAVSILGAVTSSGGKIGNKTFMVGNAGGGSYYNLSNNDYFSAHSNNNWSISLWFKTNSTSETYMYAKYNTTTSGTMFGFGNAVAGCLSFQVRATNIAYAQYCNGTANLGDNNWHHAVGVRSGNLLLIYIDGYLRNTTTAALTAYVDLKLYMVIN